MITSSMEVVAKHYYCKIPAIISACNDNITKAKKLNPIYLRNVTNVNQSYIRCSYKDIRKYFLYLNVRKE